MQRCLVVGVVARSAAARSNRPLQQVSQRKFHRTEQSFALNEFIFEVVPLVGSVGLGVVCGAVLGWGIPSSNLKNLKKVFNNLSFCFRIDLIISAQSEELEKQPSCLSDQGAIEMTLHREYVAPKPQVDLPMIQRSNESDLKHVIASRGVFLLVGPSNSGKSYYFQQLVNGRSATIFISGNEIGTTKEELLEGIADAFGYGPTRGTERFLAKVLVIYFCCF